MASLAPEFNVDDKPQKIKATQNPNIESAEIIKKHKLFRRLDLVLHLSFFRKYRPLLQ